MRAWIRTVAMPRRWRAPRHGDGGRTTARRASRPAPRAAPDHAPVPLPTMTLVEVLAEARSWQREAEEVIDLCVAAGGKTAALARRTGLVATVYSRLLEVARGLPPSPARAEVVRLLTFHHRLLHEALQLGFRPDSPGRERIAAHFRGGLADPGRRLVALYEDLVLRPPPEPPPARHRGEVLDRPGTAVPPRAGDHHPDAGPDDRRDPDDREGGATPTLDLSAGPGPPRSRSAAPPGRRWPRRG